MAEVRVLDLRRDLVVDDRAPGWAERLLAELLAEMVEPIAHGRSVVGRSARGLRASYQLIHF